jgi:hypothetical protein
MPFEFLDRLTGNKRDKRLTMDDLAVSRAQMQGQQGTQQPQGGPQPVSLDQLAQPSQPRKSGGLSLDSLIGGANKIAGGIGDFMTGDNYQRESMDIARDIGRLNRQGQDRKFAQDQYLQQQRALGQTTAAKPFNTTMQMDDGWHNVLVGVDGGLIKDLGLLQPKEQKDPPAPPQRRIVNADGSTTVSEWNGRNWGFVATEPGKPKENPAGKPLSQSEVDDITMIETAAKTLSDIETAHGGISGVQKGPLLGRIAGLNPYDEDIRQLEKLIDSVTPALARGVFREVGVLTDSDIQRYRGMLPSARMDPEVAKKVFADLKRKIQDTYSIAIGNLGKAGRDISKFDANKQLYPKAGSGGPTGNLKRVR